MMQSVQIFVLLLILEVTKIHCLECFDCSAIDSGPCFSPRAFKMKTKTFVTPSMQNSEDVNNEADEIACYMYQYRTMGQKLVLRAGKYKNDADTTCSDLKRNTDIELDYCATCSTDNCNSAVSSRLSYRGLMLISIGSVMLATVY